METAQAQGAIAARGVSKKFCRSLKRILLYGLTDVCSATVGIRPNYALLRKGEFWAVDELDLAVRAGEVLGLIGPNGSGKTTLLRLLAGIMPIDKGMVETRGRVSTLITLGAGFHPHMSVRENIFLNGTILGMTREEIERKIERIIEFSGLLESLDTPVAVLSSGMRVRLGFSIAIAMRPDVLLIDEVLAVGDQEFREKCIAEITRLANTCAIVFVSHNMDYVKRVCTRLAVMKRGAIADEYADVDEGVTRYCEVHG